VSAIVAAWPTRNRRSQRNYGKRRAGGFPADFRRIAPNILDLPRSIDGAADEHVGLLTLEFEDLRISGFRDLRIYGFKDFWKQILNFSIPEILNLFR